MNLRTSNYGKGVTGFYEGRFLKAYQDSVGVWTIGTGHTGSDVKPGMVITQEEANALLTSDLAKAEGYVNSLHQDLDQQQFDALVSFVFNLGMSNLLRLFVPQPGIRRTLDEVADAMLKYDEAGGQVSKGLVKRRNAESMLFRGDGLALSNACGQCASQPWEPCVGTLTAWTPIPHGRRIVEASAVANAGSSSLPVTDEVIERTGLV